MPNRSDDDVVGGTGSGSPVIDMFRSRNFGSLPRLPRVGLLRLHSQRPVAPGDALGIEWSTTVGIAYPSRSEASSDELGELPASDAGSSHAWHDAPNSGADDSGT